HLQLRWKQFAGDCHAAKYAARNDDTGVRSAVKITNILIDGVKFGLKVHKYLIIFGIYVDLLVL
ncbi:MAG: hypothetical protein KDH97_17890, partial [Calditrichaeota bacterium]|nr:hypothetical protein [Calditrichota bacterium]